MNGIHNHFMWEINTGSPFRVVIRDIDAEVIVCRVICDTLPDALRFLADKLEDGTTDNIAETEISKVIIPTHFPHKGKAHLQQMIADGWRIVGVSEGYDPRSGQSWDTYHLTR